MKKPFTTQRRKLVRQGPTSLTVSIPASWAKKHGLSAGDQVLLRTQQNSIQITPDFIEKNESVIRADVTQRSNTYIGLFLHAAHKKGFDEVILKSTTKQHAFIQQRVQKNLLGFEIVHQSAKDITIRAIAQPDFEELPNLIRRSFLVTLALTEAISEGSSEPSDVIMLEETNNRLTNACERIISKNTYKMQHAVYTYILVWLLEKMADLFKDLVTHNIEINKTDATMCHNLLSEFYKLFYSYSAVKHDTFLDHLGKATLALRKKKSSLVPFLEMLYQTGGSIIAMKAESV